MSLKKLPHERGGWGATLLVLLVLMGVMTALGIVVWLRMTPWNAPTQPSQQTGKPHSELRVPIRPHPFHSAVC